MAKDDHQKNEEVSGMKVWKFTLTIVVTTNHVPLKDREMNIFHTVHNV